MPIRSSFTAIESIRNGAGIVLSTIRSGTSRLSYDLRSQQALDLYFPLDLIKFLLYYRRMDSLAALAEPTRRTILEMLAKSGSLSATDIYRQFDSSPPAISQHLKVLRETKLVRVEKRAQQRIYYVNAEPLRELEKWLQGFTAAQEERYSALDKLLEREKSKLRDKKEKEND